MSSCIVCTEQFTPVYHKKIVCEKCSYETCSKCVENYMLSVPGIQCMNCKAEWSMDFLEASVSAKYIKYIFPEHQLDVLFELEKSLLPETIRDLQTYKREEEALARRNKLEGYIGMLEGLNTLVENPPKLDRICKEFSNYPKELKPNPEAMNELYDKLEKYVEKDDFVHSMIPHSMFMNRSLFKVIVEHVKLTKMLLTDDDIVLLCHHVHKACEQQVKQLTDEHEDEPENVLLIRCNREKCPNFLTKLSEQLGECKRCNTKQCLKCRVTVEDGKHKCDSMLVKALELVANTTKSCPHCKEVIERVYGCDQMFCTMCNTAFDWNTNQIIKGNIHNPHYFEWLQNNQVEQDGEGDHPFFNYHKLNAALLQFLRKHHRKTGDLGWYEFENSVYTKNLALCLEELWRTMTEVVDLVNRQANDDPKTWYVDLRRSYYQGKLTESKWKSELRKQKYRSDCITKANKIDKQAILRAQKFFQKLIDAQLVTKEDDEALLVLEEVMIEAIEFAHWYNQANMFAEDYARSFMSVPTQDMLEFGLYIDDVENEEEGGNRFVTRRNNVRMHQVFSIVDVDPDERPLPFNYKYQVKVLKNKKTILNELAKFYRLQKVSSKCSKIMEAASESEKWFIDTRIDLEGVKAVSSADMLVELVGVRDWHKNLRSRFNEALHNAIERPDGVTSVILGETEFISGLVSKCIQDEQGKLGRLIREQYWFANKDKLLAKIEHHEICFYLGFLSSYNCGHETMYNDYYSFIDVENKPEEDYPLYTYRWIPDFNKVTVEYLSENAEKVYSNIREELGNIFDARMRNRCHCMILSPTNNRKVYVQDQMEYFKTKIQPLLAKMNLARAQKLYDVWIHRKKCYYESCMSTALFHLEPSMGFHVAREVYGVRVEVPKWFEWLLDKNFRSVILERDEKTEKFNTAFSCFWIHFLTSSVMFTVYLDGQRSSYEELLYLLYLQDEWTEDCIKTIRHRLDLFYNLESSEINGDLQYSVGPKRPRKIVKLVNETVKREIAKRSVGLNKKTNPYLFAHL